MKFSVIIPIYNKLPHLERSINSVLSQTYQDFEIILVDDASTDGSSEKIKEFKDPRIRIYTRTEPGPGGYAARNLGIEKAKGEWITFLDADDEWYPHHLAKMNELAIKYPCVKLMSCGWLIRISSQGESTNSYHRDNHKKKSTLITLDEYLMNGVNNTLPICTIVACVRNTSSVVKNIFPDTSGAMRGGDLHAWLNLICYHKKMAWSNHIGAIYHKNSINMVTKNAKYSAVLMSKNIYRKFAMNLDYNEKILLKKYLNKRLKNAVISSKLKYGKSPTGVVKELYWNGDFGNSLYILLLHLIPLKYIKNTISK